MYELHSMKFLLKFQIHKNVNSHANLSWPFKIGSFKKTLIENFSMTKANEGGESPMRRHLAGRSVGDEKRLRVRFDDR